MVNLTTLVSNIFASILDVKLPPEVTLFELAAGTTFCGSCALQAHEIQQPEMAALVKPGQQPGTESCVVSGNGHCEA